MKILLILLVFCLIGCEQKTVYDANDLIMAAKDDPQLLIYSAVDIENMPSSDEAYQSIELNYFPEENSFFMLAKEIYCSDDPYAKYLVNKYVLTSNNINCEGVGE